MNTLVLFAPISVESQSHERFTPSFLSRIQATSDRIINIATMRVLLECYRRGAPAYFYVFDYYNKKCIGPPANNAPCSGKVVVEVSSLAWSFISSKT